MSRMAWATSLAEPQRSVATRSGKARWSSS